MTEEMTEDTKWETLRVAELLAARTQAHTIQDAEDRYAATSTVAHGIHNFVTANDLMFSLSDLDTKVDGELRCKVIRRKVQSRRRQLALNTGLLSARTTQHVETHSARTGRHRHLAVHMPDGTIRAVWKRHDGPDFDGYYTAEPGGEERRTTREDYDEYTHRRFPK